MPPRSPLGGLVIAVFGPTASGKSSVAAEIVARIPAEAVSADSMQVYRGVPLLTNQPDERTHLVAVRPLEHEVSVVEYQRLAHAVIDALLERGRTPIVVGGTGLYLRAALAELGVPPAAPPGVRERWERAYDRLGPENTYALLVRRDPAAAASLHPNDRRRVVRALELVDTGHSLRPPRARLWSDETRHPTLSVGLDLPRDVLARRIEARTRAMFARGVEQEVRRAMAGPLSATASQMIGLREVHELPPEEAIAAISLRTRQYAAYQRKWMRRIPGLASVRADRPPGEIADDILEMARRRERVPAARAG